MAKQTKSFTEKEYDSEKSLILYGASVYGEIAYYALETMGIKPDYFCDRSNRVEQYHGIKVIKPQELCGEEQIIICSSDYFHDIRKQLEVQGCKNLYDMEYLIRRKIDTGILSARAKNFYDNSQNYLDVIHLNEDKDVFFERIQYVVTEACSLRCRDCSHLMQYYEHPQNIDLEKYKMAFDRLLDCVTQIADLRILGGEPFVNIKMYQLIDWYANSEKIKMISVYTNGTIIPNKSILDALANDKVRVHISNYKVRTAKTEQLMEVFDKYGIKYFLQDYQGWQETGNLVKRGFSDEKKQEMFQACFERMCITFFKGSLHHCPRSAHAMNLGAMPDIKKDYVDLMDEGKTRNKLIEELKNFRDVKFVEACDYCDGPDFHKGGAIPVAVQTDKIRKFNE